MNSIIISLILGFSLTFLHHSIFTLILMISVLFVYLINVKKHKLALLYGLSIIIYLLFGYLNSLVFQSLVPGNFNYNIFGESLQILKYATVLFFYLSIREMKINYDRVIKIWSVCIFLLIFITNIFKISISSYNNEVIKGSLIDWFSNTFAYDELASKGFFMYANQISLLILLFSMYFIFKKKDHLYLFLNIFIGVIIGTRISTFLPIALLGMFTFTIIGIDIYSKKLDKKLYFKNILIILFVAMLLPFSPQRDRIETYNLYDVNTQYKVELASTSEIYYNEVEFKKEYIKNNYEAKNINKQFVINSYPYEYDPDFWIEIMDLPYEKRIDYRFLEESMVKRVYEINDNSYDYLFGIGVSRIYNIWNIESDLVMQFYSFGLIGFLIIFFVYFLMAKDLLIRLVTKKDIRVIYSLAMLFVFLFVAYLSGNILNSLSITLISIVTINCYREL